MKYSLLLSLGLVGVLFSCTSNVRGALSGVYVSSNEFINPLTDNFSSTLTISSIEEETFLKSEGKNTLESLNGNFYRLDLYLTKKGDNTRYTSDFYDLSYNSVTSSYIGSFVCPVLYLEMTPRSVSLYFGFDGAPKGILLRDDFKGEFLFCFLPTEQ